MGAALDIAAVFHSDKSGFGISSLWKDGGLVSGVDVQTSDISVDSIAASSDVSANAAGLSSKGVFRVLRFQRIPSQFSSALMLQRKHC